VLDERFQSVDLAVSLPLNQLNLTEGTLSNNLDSRKILGSLLGPQKSQIFGFGASHLILLLSLAGIRV
jgi:hypothetical protein